jgi:hypothetical protein
MVTIEIFHQNICLDLCHSSMGIGFLIIQERGAEIVRPNYILYMGSKAFLLKNECNFILVKCGAFTL